GTGRRRLPSSFSSTCSCGPGSYGHGRLDGRVMLVVHDLKVFIVVIKNCGWPTRQVELRQCQRHSRQLLVDLLEMVGVQVTVAAGPDEFAHLEVALLRQHVREQRIGSDVERHAEKNVGAALVDLATQT